MLPQSLVYIWLSVFTLLAGGFLCWMWASLPMSRIRTLFLAFLVPYVIWGEALLLIQLIGAHDDYSRFISQIIFLCGGLFHAVLGLFFLEFISIELRPRKLGMAIFLGLLGTSISSLVGLVEEGVVYTENSGLYPEPGILSPLFNLLILAWGLYYFILIREAFRKLESFTFVKVQLRFVALPAVGAIGTTLVTNVIIPGLGGTYALTPLAAFWIFFFLISVGYTVTQGQRLLVYQSAKSFDEIVGVIGMPSLEETADKFVRFLSPAVQAARNSMMDGARHINTRPLTYPQLITASSSNRSAK